MAKKRWKKEEIRKKVCRNFSHKAFRFKVIKSSGTPPKSSGGHEDGSTQEQSSKEGRKK